MERTFKFKLETLFISLLLVLGIAITITAWNYGFGSLSNPGPGLYPIFIGIMISIFAFFILISEIGSKTGKSILDKKQVMTLIRMIATFSLWIIMMPLMGYVVVTLLATYTFCKIMKLEGWWKPLTVSAGTTLFIYLLFDYWLYIDFPRGIFE